MSGVKIGDKMLYIDAREGPLVCEVENIGGTLFGLRDSDGGFHATPKELALTVEQVVSLAEEMVGVPTPKEKPKDIVYITSYDTGTDYKVGQAVAVMRRRPNGRVETAEGYTLAPEWYTEEKPF